MNRNIILTGFMGTGKTTVGKQLSEMTGWSFYDTDTMIEQLTGSSISDIFSRKGEKYFRALEHEVLKKVLSGTERIISTGGGIVLNPENIRLMRNCGTTFALISDIETLWTRLGGAKDRPLLQCDNPKEKLEVLYRQREPLYRTADFTVETTNEKSPSDIAFEILKMSGHFA